MKIKIETCYGTVFLNGCYDCDSCSDYYSVYDDEDNYLGDIWNVFFNDIDDEAVEALVTAVETAIDDNDIAIPSANGTGDPDVEIKAIDEITRQDVLDFFAENGFDLFGKSVDEIADALADEVLTEYKNAGDGNIQKAISYVILDKFDALA